MFNVKRKRKKEKKSAVNENAARGIDLEQQNAERGKRQRRNRG